MPVCRKCKKEFPTKIKLNGKLRNLQRRKFCLDCSPFNTHNTSPSLSACNIAVFEGKEKKFVCKTHGSFQFKWWAGKYRCPKCNSEKVSEHRRRVKKKIVDYLGGKCLRCGYNKCNAALEPHHIDPSKKDFSISQKGHCRSFERIKIELDKCILLCSNCHREIHN